MYKYYTSIATGHSLILLMEQNKIDSKKEIIHCN